MRKPVEWMKVAARRCLRPCKRLARWCVAPGVRWLIRKYHWHCVMRAPLQPLLDELLREAIGRLRLLEARFEELDVVHSSIVRELTRLQVQTDLLQHMLETLHPRRDPSSEYRQAS